MNPNISWLITLLMILADKFLGSGRDRNKN
jgi:hypothetical protein